MRTCPTCFETHRRTPVCGSDPVAAAAAWAGDRILPAAESWVLSFAKKPEEHLSDQQCRWFAELITRHSLPPEAIAAHAEWCKTAPPDPAGHWVGVVGKRCPLSVRCDAVTSLGVGEYGERFVCNMTTDCGAKCVWFTGENLWLDPGVDYVVTARVEAHDTYQGHRQTRLSRLKPMETE